MKDRIQQFLIKENKSSAQLAEEIGVQPSGISHILSGRNKPSLDFIIKMLDRYPYLSVEWLLFGKGSIYREKSIPTLFDKINTISASSEEKPQDYIDKNEKNDLMADLEPGEDNSTANEPLEVIFFYDDGTFRSFRKRNV